MEIVDSGRGNRIPTGTAAITSILRQSTTRRSMPRGHRAGHAHETDRAYARTRGRTRTLAKGS
eukprot:9488525-Pyramimonas_sp.AAC.1